MRSTEIKGLAVFNIADGSELGKVSELIINPEKKSVQYLLVNTPNWYLGSYTIPISRIEGIGKDAVVIESASLLVKAGDDPEAIRLLDKGVKLIGSKVLTRKGKDEGLVTEFYVDEANGQVTGCELTENGNVRGIIPSSAALSFGREALMVIDNIDSSLIADIADFRPATAAPSALEPVKAAEDDSEEKPKAVLLYEQKQREYLLGRVVRSDVSDGNGGFLVREGETITDEILDKAIAKDRISELLHHV